jgi:hypothetical protein
MGPLTVTHAPSELAIANTLELPWNGTKAQASWLL